MFKLNAKCDEDSLLYLLGHFEWDDHTVHLLTQQHLPSPLTNTVNSSLFTQAHSSPLSLAAKLHRCHADRSHYINNGWTFSRQTSYKCVCILHDIFPLTFWCIFFQYVCVHILIYMLVYTLIYIIMCYKWTPTYRVKYALYV